MDNLEVQIDQNRLAAFDGRVLEVFGGSVRRFHTKLLTVRVSQPDKRGNRSVTLVQAQQDTGLAFDEPQFELIQPLLDALKSAGVDVQG